MLSSVQLGDSPSREPTDSLLGFMCNSGFCVTPGKGQGCTLRSSSQQRFLDSFFFLNTFPVKKNCFLPDAEGTVKQGRCPTLPCPLRVNVGIPRWPLLQFDDATSASVASGELSLCLQTGAELGPRLAPPGV